MTIQLPSLEQMLTHEQMWRTIKPDLVKKFISTAVRHDLAPRYAFQDHPHFETYQHILELYLGVQRFQSLPIIGLVQQSSRPLNERNQLQKESENPTAYQLAITLADTFGQAMTLMEIAQEEHPDTEIKLENLKQHQTQRTRVQQSRRKFEQLRKYHSTIFFEQAIYSTLAILSQTRHFPLKTTPDLSTGDNQLYNELGEELYSLAKEFEHYQLPPQNDSPVLSDDEIIFHEEAEDDIIYLEMTPPKRRKTPQVNQISIAVDEIILRIMERTSDEYDGVSYDPRQQIQQSAYIARLIDNLGAKHPAIKLLSTLGMFHATDRRLNHHYAELAAND